MTQASFSEIPVELVTYKNQPIGTMRRTYVRDATLQLPVIRGRRQTDTSRYGRAIGVDRFYDRAEPKIATFAISRYMSDHYIQRDPDPDYPDHDTDVACICEIDRSVADLTWNSLFIYPCLQLESLNDIKNIPNFQYQSWSDGQLPAYEAGHRAECLRMLDDFYQDVTRGASNPVDAVKGFAEVRFKQFVKDEHPRGLGKENSSSLIAMEENLIELNKRKDYWKKSYHEMDGNNAVLVSTLNALVQLVAPEMMTQEVRDELIARNLLDPEVQKQIEEDAKANLRPRVLDLT